MRAWLWWSVNLVSEGIQGVPWTTAKEYSIIKYTIVYLHSLQRLIEVDAILYNHKTILMLYWRYLLLTTRIFRNQRWNLATISILVGYEYMLNLPLFGYHTYELINVHAYIHTRIDTMPWHDWYLQTYWIFTRLRLFLSHWLMINWIFSLTKWTD